MNSSVRVSQLIGSITCLSALFLASCGGSSSNSPAAANAISGSVAVGVPMTDAILRVVDATGALVASNIPVAPDGTYPPITLAGPPPYRIEVCGYTGANYDCIYSVAEGPGVANVTPLTSATVLLASGSAPGTLMSGAATGLDTSSIEAAQSSLQLALADVLSSAGVAADLDFITGDLDAGSRTGYDFVLDSVGVTTGVDNQPFVQITPRLGSGNVFIEAGSAAVGDLTVAADAGDLPLAGLETLFENMTAALVNAEVCLDPVAGLRGQLASDARLNDGAGSANGPAEVADALCGLFAGGDDEPAMFGSRLVNPNLGRCDFSGEAPRCRITFVLQFATGEIQPISDGIGVILENGAWKFLGDLDPVSISASARAQRTQRVDENTLPVSYARALAFDIPAIPGLECAEVSQTNAAGEAVTVAYFKRHAPEQDLLSLWAVDGFSNMRSLDPESGATRSTDDSWVALPEGLDGDAVIRNFYRGGRAVTVSLFADTACATPLPVEGRSIFQVDVQGVPPTWAAMSNLPWPEPTAGAVEELRNLAMAAGATSNYTANWTFPNGRSGISEASFCTSGNCASGSPERIGEVSFLAGATSVSIPLQAADALAADDYKQLTLGGRTGDGVGLQSNTMSCPLTAAGDHCQ